MKLVPPYSIGQDACEILWCVLVLYTKSMEIGTHIHSTYMWKCEIDYKP